ncbi:MAG TPA: twin-arginine translocase TatA/TatE family subunit [Anaeromyxobacter sp.]|nr:twin-arginine translocase TatA/TatE family subunit [Anaeromyxobacter sp.]
MGGLRFQELLLILLIVLLLFGASKLPQIGAGLGQSIRGFKKALSGDDDEKPARSASQPSDPGAPKT